MCVSKRVPQDISLRCRSAAPYFVSAAASRHASSAAAFSVVNLPAAMSTFKQNAGGPAREEPVIRKH